MLGGAFAPTGWRLENRVENAWSRGKFLCVSPHIRFVSHTQRKGKALFEFRNKHFNALKLAYPYDQPSSPPSYRRGTSTCEVGAFLLKGAGIESNAIPLALTGGIPVIRLTKMVP